jgi:tRNA-modifying protein YgfZ
MYGIVDDQQLSHVQENGVAIRYAEDTEWKAREAWRYGVVLVDRSHWGRLRFSGDGRLEFLHAQSTQDLKQLATGKLAHTVRLLVLSLKLCLDS